MIAENIAALHKSRHLSQEKMADLFGVSRQAIQKWESGAAVPEVSKLIDMAKTFGVSLDSLLCGGARATDEIRFEKRIEPAYHALEEWEDYACLLETEYVQCMEEGARCSAAARPFIRNHKASEQPVQRSSCRYCL